LKDLKAEHPLWGYRRCWAYLYYSTTGKVYWPNENLFLVSDNGCQPTSLSYMQACSTLGIKQIFTSWSDPKGNADTERVIRTLKENLLWPYD